MLSVRAFTAFLMYALMSISLVSSGSMSCVTSGAGLATPAAHASPMHMGHDGCGDCGCPCATGACASCSQCGASPAEVTAANATPHVIIRRGAIRFTHVAIALARNAPEPPPPRA